MRILFFTPTGGLSGSEMMLYYVLGKLDPSEFEAALFCPRRGELLGELPGSVPAYSFAAAETLFGKARDRLSRRLMGRSLTEEFVVGLHRRFRPDLWYVNTVVMPEVARLACRLGVPYAVHCHEMPLAYQDVSKDDLRATLEGAALVVACSRAVLDRLRHMGVGAELQYECVDLARVRPDPDGAAALRREMGVAPGAFVWGMSGRAEYRKGSDIVVEVARSLRGRDVHFLWIGPPAESGFQYYVERAIAHHGLKNVHLVGQRREDYYDHLACLDGFLLTSREDPFPLVMIEAAALGKPIVSFNSGGVSEFVLPGMGAVVDSWNAPDLIRAMEGVMGGAIPCDPDASKGRAAEFDAAVQTRHWEGLMRKHFGEASGRPGGPAIAGRGDGETGGKG